MKLFADTANLVEIEGALEGGFIAGVTTNPSILAKEEKTDYLKHLWRIVALLGSRQSVHEQYLHLSVEVFSRDRKEIVRQAHQFRNALAGYKGLSIKVQIGLAELGAIRELAGLGISVNCTCCMKANQAILAAASGAKFVSLFWGRIRDGGGDPVKEVGQTRILLDKSYPDTKIIVGSIRQESDITEAGMAGTDFVTVPPRFFGEMATHPKTDEVVKEFFTKFQEWLK